MTVIVFVINIKVRSLPVTVDFELILVFRFCSFKHDGIILRMDSSYSRF